MTLLAVAHRAGNSPAALRAALSRGADAVEADVHLTASGRLELHHLTRLGGLPWSLDQRRRALWRLVPDTAPRFALADLFDALDRCEGAPAVVLDLKGDGTGRAVADLLRTRPRPVRVCGNWTAVQVAAVEPGVAALRSAGTPAELLHALGLVRGGAGLDGVSARLDLLEASLVRELREGGAEVLAWPVNGHRALSRARALGVTGVITDDPGVLRAAGDA